MTPERMSTRRERRTGLARLTRIVRYLVEDAIGIVADLGYEIRDRGRGTKHPRRRGRSRTTTR